MNQLEYSDLKKMEVGQQFYESGQYGNMLFTVATDPVETVDGEYTQLRWEGSVEGEEDNISYLITKEAQHYGPSIYTTPAYIGVPQRGY